MTQGQKDLLLKDLSTRLPYGVILNCCNIVGEKLYTIDSNGLVNKDYDLEEVKPYLFPLSSMTDEQKKEFDQLLELELKAINDEIDPMQATIFEVDFYNKHHLDWRRLTPKGLAIDATGLNIY